MPSSVQNILISILKSPHPQTVSELSTKIKTEEGKNDFIENIRNNNSLAYIYLKQYMTENIRNKTHREYASTEFLLFLISVSQKNNLGYSLAYLEQLSILGEIQQDFVVSMAQNRRYDALDAVFRKYTTEQKSDALYLEIIRSIELMAPVFDEVYRKDGDFTGNAAVYDENLLSIFYSLIYQDIHPYFEDNYRDFFRTLSVLFTNENTRELVIKIYDTFILKYPDCTDFSNLILSLCSIESFNYQAISTLTHAYSYVKIHDKEITEMLRRILVFSVDDVDILQHTLEMLRGVDSVRGGAHKLIRALNPNISTFGTEIAIFVATVLKNRDQNILTVAKNVVTNKSAVKDTDCTLAFTAFLYLIKVQEYVPCSLEYLDTAISPVCMKYCSEVLRSNDRYHSTALGLCSRSENKQILNTEALYQRVMTSLITEIDEITSELILRIIKEDAERATKELFVRLTALFKKINVISTASLQYLFDVYILLSVKFRSFDQGVVEKILGEEILDCYVFCFFYLSVVFDAGLADNEGVRGLVLQILQQDKLWSDRSVQFSMVCLAIAAYRRGLVAPQQIALISQSLRDYGRIVLSYKCGGKSQSSNGSSDPVENLLAGGKLDREWLINNYINKRYVRMVLRKLNAMGERELVLSVANKNVRFIEEEVTMHSVIAYFEL